MDSWVRNQVGLELVEIDVQGTIETEGGGDRRDNYGMVSLARLYQDAGSEFTLSNETIQVLIVGSLDTEVASADVIDSLVVDHETAVGMLKGGVSGQDGVVWLDNRSCNLRSWVDTKLKLALLAIVNRETLHQKSTEARSCTTTEGVEDKETLQATAVVGNMSNLVQDLINQLFSNSVVTTSIVVASILLSSDHLVGMEQASVGASADFIDNVGLEIAVDGSWDIFAISCDELCQ